jgi:DNA polymerase (family X)
MENVEFSRVLSEVADLLEIQGANPFRVRAYAPIGTRFAPSKASPALLSEMVAQEEDLEELPGIGKDIAGYIPELIETGELRLLKQIEAQVPETLADLLRLEGIGPKRAEKLWHGLGIESVDDLTVALDRGRLEGLRGFGEKTREKLRHSITDFRKHAGRALLSEADQLVKPLLAHMAGAPGIEKLDVAGSYRRRRETVGDIDILAVCDDPAPVMEHFIAYEGSRRVESAGGTRGSTIVLRTGLHVDLRIVPRESYGAALHYLTGSKDHNVAIRRRGIEHGLKINEYGVFQVGKKLRAKGNGRRKGRRVAGADETEVYGAVDLPWIPPELRENRGEIEAAERAELPQLVELGDIRGDLQVHTTWSDGKRSIREMAEGCRDRGYAYMAVTDHSKRVTVAHGLDAKRARRQWTEIEKVRAAVEGIHIFRSMEVDILRDGSLDLDDEHLERLDLVLVTVHSYMDLPKKEQTARIVKAIGHPAVHVLGHPTGRLINVREPYDVDLDDVLHAAKEHRVAVELNANPERLDLADVHVMRARELGVPVIISTDAHSIDNLRYMRYGVDQARRGWLEKNDVLNTKTLAQLRRWLERA